MELYQSGTVFLSSQHPRSTTQHSKPRKPSIVTLHAQHQQPHFAAPYRITTKPIHPTFNTSFTPKQLEHAPSTTVSRATPTTSSTDETDSLAGDYCLPAYITINNTANPNFTVLEVEVLDYPGLMRVIAWVLNGLDIVAQNAILRTGPDGTAHNTFWLSTRTGKKLKESAAEGLAERVKDFVAYCSPKPGVVDKTEFGAGPISISNTEHNEYTVITVKEMKRTPGFLLEIASVLSGLNVEVLQGIIQGCKDCGDDVPHVSDDVDNGGARIFKFWVRDREKQKLDFGAISALIYTLSLGLGFDHYPLTPVDQEIQ